MSKKYNPNGEIEFRPVYFNSITRTALNHKFSLENAFKKFYTGLTIGLMKDLDELPQYSNVSTYRPLSASSNIKLPVELRSAKK